MRFTKSQVREQNKKAVAKRGRSRKWWFMLALILGFAGGGASEHWLPWVDSAIELCGQIHLGQAVAQD